MERKLALTCLASTATLVMVLAGCVSDAGPLGSTRQELVGMCGDGVCDPGESTSCPADCPSPPPPVCGNSKCEGNEADYCPDDCPVCGNGICNMGEDYVTCPEDCTLPKTCGNGVCGDAETCQSCPQDCGICSGQNCGDGYCEIGETCTYCPQDCGSCTPPDGCGDGLCRYNENCATCAADCGACAPCLDDSGCPTGSACINGSCST
jgi:hypothetical protein